MDTERLGEGDNPPKCSSSTPNHSVDTIISFKEYGPLLPLATSTGNGFIYYLFRFTG